MNIRQQQVDRRTVRLERSCLRRAFFRLRVPLEPGECSRQFVMTLRRICLRRGSLLRNLLGVGELIVIVKYLREQEQRLGIFACTDLDRFP
jgi:hypothetical protein